MYIFVKKKLWFPLYLTTFIVISKNSSKSIKTLLVKTMSCFLAKQSEMISSNISIPNKNPTLLFDSGNRKERKTICDVYHSSASGTNFYLYICYHPLLRMWPRGWGRIILFTAFVNSSATCYCCCTHSISLAIILLISQFNRLILSCLTRSTLFISCIPLFWYEEVVDKYS